MLLCAFVLALCLAHQLLMASEQHAAVMEPTSARFALAPLALPAAEGSGHGGLRLPEPSMPLLGDCPAQQAILPVLLALLVLGCLVGACSWPALLTPCVSLERAPSAHGPPLSAARRRALLQVFLN